MAGTTITGVGSGFDTQAIVKSLVDAERAPKQAQINLQSQKATTQLSSIGKIQAALDAFRGALTSMGTDNSFSGLTGTSSDEKVATMTANQGAASGSFSLVVNQLATPSKLSTKSFTGGQSTVVNSGTTPTTLTISQSGKNFDLKVPAGATLQQVRDSINSQFGTAGLSANILTDSNGSRLILTSTNAGVGSDLTMSGNSGIDTGYTVVSEPKNAKYTIDGIAAESKTNSITDAVSGVSIKLLSVSPLTTPSDTASTARNALTISVSTSTTALKSGVKGFVDTYNALLKAMNAETKVTKDAAGNSVAATLTGDSTMRTLQAAIRNEFNALSGNGTLKSLAQFGVTTDRDTGALSIDAKQWDKAVLTNAADINSIFSGKTGLLARLTAATDGYAKATTGILATRSTSLSDSLKDLNKQQVALDERLTTMQDSLTRKYTAMDTLVAQLRQQSSSILGTLSALSNAQKSS
ncbi:MULTISPECIES: flagellar filament capping protein FliD [unclassified Pseudomonas]|uniref:flagellar filament capping protein FliD n=1 Tax=unclassified Pseudomonas TaxID=196821 RepID=UPI0008F27EC2|nr:MULTISPECIES: flagellar filament capping protein FliD [unclassified Pseudomonas]PMV23461.1 flagellar cap protein FliD [Pseudomonas sp. FW305-3-2-15-C-TSA2]PMV30964.1 flagellar cap protein FliD [Pseudomonas sp. DP16D-L5]PMV39557.1 flagellar cap protein FliD [Pseudomonas sp. FW305-3-2-15-A-LB2]PMV45311.1 flagellar cap protein FliD [Pseudomonas sp. FW305-3-2-15-C-R2A1]PMV52207.1 flagellar cap protein FliD [Pseudomonas sp. FW305-3-2-15-C-LB1]